MERTGFASSLRVEETDVGDRAVEDLSRAAQHEAAALGLAAAVHVGVAHAPPLVRVALVDAEVAFVVELRAPEIARNVERIRKQHQLGARLLGDP